MKKELISIFILSFLFSNLYGQIENEPCTAIPWDCSTIINTVNAPQDGFSQNNYFPCGIGAGTTEDNPTWYIYTATSTFFTIDYTISQCKGLPDFTGEQITIFSGTDCSSLINVNCVTIENDGIGSLTTPTVPQQKYWIQVDGIIESVCNYTLYIAPTPLSPIPISKTICFGETASLSLPIGNTYQWNNGNTTQIINVNPSFTTTYTGNVNTNNGCFTQKFNVSVDNIAKASPDKSICLGQSTTLQVNKGTAYQWSTGQSTQSITVSPTSNTAYFVTLYDGVCIGYDTVNVNVNPLPLPKILGNSSFCLGSSTVLNTQKYSTYLWNTAAKDSFLIVDKAGQYGLTVTDAEGCVGSVLISVTQTVGFVPPILGSKILCKGEKIILKTDIYKTYLWSDGSQTDSIVVNKSGNYKVSVSDFLGCIGENEITVIEKELEKPKIIGITIFCEGYNSNLSVSNYNLFNSFEWSNGVKNISLNVYKSGTYSVSVSDGVCTAQSDILVIAAKNTLKASIIGDSILCENEKTILSNSDKDVVTYAWKNSAQNVINQSSLTTKGNTTWSLTVTDKFGCSATSKLKIIEIPLPKTIIKGDTLLINGTSTLLNAGAGFSSYLWNTGEVAQVITITQSGVYSVTISNQNGCTNIASIVVKPINFIKPYIGGNNKICTNQKTVLSLGGIFDSYLWSNGAKTASIEVSKGGIYYVSVTKGVLTGKDTFEVKQSILNPTFLTSNYNGFGVSCEGNQDGFIEIKNLIGAINPLTFKWSNGATTSTINSLKSGTYQVTVNDAFACEWISKTSITEPEKITLQTTEIQLNCKSLNSAQIILQATENAIFPLKIKLNQQDFAVQKTPFSFKNLNEGNYNLQLSDANNCTASQSIFIEKQIVPTVSLGDDIEAYIGDEIQLLAQSNIIPSTIFWTKINDLSCSTCMNPIVKPLQSGEYEIRIKDKLSCEASDKIKITLNKDIYIPNVFTPNDDGVNDFFTIFGNKSVKEILYFGIFDRWGNLVFQGDANNNQWDGTFRNQPCQIGAYTYLVQIAFKNAKIEKFKGEVTLCR
jgi:gliding motility-associated-like protein